MIAVRIDAFTINFTPEVQDVLATLRGMRASARLHGDRLWVAVTLLEWVAGRDNSRPSIVTVEESLIQLAKVREDEGYGDEFDGSRWEKHALSVFEDLSGDPERIFQH